MSSLRWKMWALGAVCLAALAAGCAPVSQNGSTLSNANANRANANGAPTASPTAGAASGSATAGQPPVTLAVLDAFFAEESFPGELKTRLQLSDEQVERLRRAAGEERARLGEDGGEAREGATREATERAEAKVSEVVGAEKTAQLFAYVRERWSGGSAQASATPASAKPNAVPSDTRIVVNIPAYRMDAFEGGRLVKSYKVGIGYPEFPLPTGMRKAETIIFNPTWTPPDEPWVKGQFKPGQKVEAGSKANPLGLIKIPIGSPSLIHGGKSPARIGSFASHGCVGLTNPQVQDFAVVLAQLGGEQLGKEQIDAYARTRAQTRNLKLTNNVPVELRYETIVVEDGKLYIYRDVYDRGTNTEENLRKVLEAHGVRVEDLSAEERAQVTEALSEMARDAYGKPTTGAGATPTPTPRRGGPVRETKTIKGKKEVVVEVAALKGKGYPAPVNLSTGGAPQPKPAAPKPARRQAAGR